MCMETGIKTHFLYTEGHYILYSSYVHISTQDPAQPSKDAGQEGRREQSERQRRERRDAWRSTSLHHLRAHGALLGR